MSAFSLGFQSSLLIHTNGHCLFGKQAIKNISLLKPVTFQNRQKPFLNKTQGCTKRDIITSKFEISESMPFDANPLVIVISLIGWTLPASIPSNIPLLKGTGLSQAFLASVQANLAAWPKGPALDDPFWLYMVIWHLGLFTVLFFGTIGYGISQRRV